MRKKIASLCLLCAWLCANGALLDALQVFAWGKMFAGYSRAMPAAAALRETFNPAKPCELCVAVAVAKDDLGQKDSPATSERAAEKLLLALHLPTAFFIGGTAADWPAGFSKIAASHVEPVPVPPPRA